MTYLHWKKMNFIKHIKNLIHFNQLPKEQRRVVFYSEGRNYYPHLQGIIKTLLDTTNIPICYISSGHDDPGLFITHQNYKAFKIDESWIRNWLFENIDTDIMVITMPDIQQYQVKRSKHPVHYMYVQHSLVSLHMVYRNGAFDHYDTICCAGPHHVTEMHAIEKAHQLPAKKILEHGYGRLDSIIKQAQSTKPKDKDPQRPKHILVAPSWGPNGVIETMGDKLVDALLNSGFKVTLRPHPQTAKLAKNKLNAIVNKHQDNPLFDLEANMGDQASLHMSDLMISDWSGAALDYAFGLEKPVLFMDVPKKINNPDYEKLNIEPLEVSIRSVIGDVLDINKLDELGQRIDELLSRDFKQEILAARERYVFNCLSSDQVAAKYIQNLLMA
jgi:CDP-glycerol glycerophosphotransferase (TagB/SpsB family)